MKNPKTSSLLEQIPNMLTTINLLMGVLAILLMVGGGFPNAQKTACAMIFIGAIADALDGKAARLLNAQSDFGKQLDSFADSITFGLAPVAVLYSFKPLQKSLLVLVAMAVYTMAGVFRLARFNLGDFSDYFLGLPITAAGALTAMYGLLLSFTIDFYGAELSSFTAFLLFTLSGFMISTLRVPRPRLNLPWKQSTNTEKE